MDIGRLVEARSGPSKPLLDFPNPAAWVPCPPHLLCDMDRSMIGSNNSTGPPASQSGNVCFSYCCRLLPSRLVPQAGKWPRNAQTARILLFFFLCKPIATLPHGKLFGWNVTFGNRAFDTNPHGTPPKNKPMDQRTRQVTFRALTWSVKRVCFISYLFSLTPDNSGHGLLSYAASCSRVNL